MDVHADRILILDFGSQYTQLIARRVREASVYSEIQPFDMSAAAIRAFKPRGIILSGGPESVIVAKNVVAPDDGFCKTNTPDPELPQARDAAGKTPSFITCSVC